MACNFIKVGSAATCEENYSGVGSKFYIFSKAEGVAADGAETLDTAPEFSAGSFLPAGFHTVRIKSQSGKVTATSNANGGGFNNVYTCVVNKDMEKMSDVMRIMNNTTDWGIAVPTGNKKEVTVGEDKKTLDEFIVLYSDTFDIEFSDESDTGDAPDSDHGHTLTITQSSMLYALQKWYGDKSLIAD